MPEHIVAVALVTDEELRRLGPQFDRAFPIDQTPCFGELLAAIDDADRALWQRRGKTLSVVVGISPSKVEPVAIT